MVNSCLNEISGIGFPRNGGLHIPAGLRIWQTAWLNVQDQAAQAHGGVVGTQYDCQWRTLFLPRRSYDIYSISLCTFFLFTSYAKKMIVFFCHWYDVSQQWLGSRNITTVGDAKSWDHLLLLLRCVIEQSNEAKLESPHPSKFERLHCKLKEIHLTLELPVQAFPQCQLRLFQELGVVIDNRLLCREGGSIKLVFFGMRLRWLQERMTCWYRETWRSWRANSSEC